MSEDRPVRRLGQVRESYAAHSIPDGVGVWPVVSSRLGLAARSTPVRAEEQAGPAVGGKPRRQPLTLALVATVLATSVVALSAYLVVRPRTAGKPLAIPPAIPTAVSSPEIEAAVEAFYDIDQFSGAVLVSRGEDVLFSKGYGMADFQDLVPNTPQTVFQVSAWFDEAFRGMAAMLLQERGLLDVDQPVARYLPDYSINGTVTVHHLLTHTSGLLGPLSSIPESGRLAPSSDQAQRFLAQDELRQVLPLSLGEVIESFRGKPLGLQRGEIRITNQVLFALLVEGLSGKSYEQFVEEEILRPLGMANTSYCGSEVPAGTAVTYERDLTPTDRYLDATTGPYGGPMCTTVEDLHLWSRALRPGTLLSKDSITKIFGPDIRRDRGYSWFYGDYPRGRWVFHGAEGVRVRWHIEEEVFVAVLGNAITSRTPGQALGETAGYLAEAVLSSAR